LIWRSPKALSCELVAGHDSLAACCGANQSPLHLAGLPTSERGTAVLDDLNLLQKLFHPRDKLAGV
jgi:hypothetical protein